MVQPLEPVIPEVRALPRMPAVVPFAAGAPPEGNLATPHAALKAFLELTVHSVRRLAELKTDFQAAMAQADAEEKNALASLENARQVAQQQLAHQLESQCHRLAARLADETRDAAANAASLRQRAAWDYDATREKLKHRHADALWMADVPLEAEQNRLRVEMQQCREASAARLAGKQERGLALLAKLGYSWEAERAGAPTPAVTHSPDRQELQGLFEGHAADVDRCLVELGRLSLTDFPRGAWSFVLSAGVVLLAAAIPQFLPGVAAPDFMLMAFSGLLAVLVMAGVALLLRVRTRREVWRVFRALQEALAAARGAAEELQRALQKHHDTVWAAAQRLHGQQVQTARAEAATLFKKAHATRQAALSSATRHAQERCERAAQEHAAARQQARREYDQQYAASTQKFEQAAQTLRRNAGVARAQRQARYEEGRDELQLCWRQAWTNLRRAIESPAAHADPRGVRWDGHAATSGAWPRLVRFGEWAVDLRKLVREATGAESEWPHLPEPFIVPVGLVLPREAGLLIHGDDRGRAAALAVLQVVMLRLLTTLPPGRVRFTLIDPVGLGQSFAGFMHLADDDEALVGSRIWTQTEQMEQRLTDLVEHLEIVIQKYLRNEYSTIDDYNRQAGELAEPYRFLVIADFPVGFSEEALKRLSSLAASGARCGVYMLVYRDTRRPVPGVCLGDLESHSINLSWAAGRLAWRDEILQPLNLFLDAPPGEEELRGILGVVGRRTRESKRVEIPFTTIAPAPEQFWSRRSAEGLEVALGVCGATRRQNFQLGRGVAQHVLVTGKTGSGKSTLLHVLTTNLALWYSPAELELYLIDFKKGVEFKTYAVRQLPHARAIGVETDRQFGLSVLQRVDAELTRRGELFRHTGVADLPAYRGQTQQMLPRVLLIVDEFQEFFAEDDKLAQDAAGLLDRLVRQGRAFGVHVLLGSQTIAGSSGLSRSTLGQIAVRIALQTTEADSQIVLAEGNSAARLLSRPGEAIYNDMGGRVEGNSPFQVAWLPEALREHYLDQVRQRAAEAKLNLPPAVIFEGNVPADMRQNQGLVELLKAPRPSLHPRLWLGEPVAIKEPTAVTLQRRAGGNLLLLGQDEERALAILVGAILALAAQQAPEARFYICDGSPADGPTCGTLAKVAAVTPQVVNDIAYRAVPDIITELSSELQRRREAPAAPSAAIFLIVLGLQRYRILRQADNNFHFSADSGDAQPDAAARFAQLLSDGPPVGIHVLAWVDTLLSLERTLERRLMREFDHRVLFQMSAADSSNLIDSPAANRLGPFRALAYSEEQGTLEKFRPYALPDSAFIAQAQAYLAARYRA